MNPNSPALNLLIAVCAVLVVGMPLVAWFLQHGQRDRNARLWFFGLGCNAAGLLVLGVIKSSSPVTALLVTTGVALLVESMRRELDLRALPRSAGLLGFGLYGLCLAALFGLGHWEFAGRILQYLAISVTEAALLVYVVRVGRRRRSRGLVLAALGVMSVLALNLVHLVLLVAGVETSETFAGTPLTNTTVISTTLGTVLLAIGYGGFMLEKASARHLEDVAATARAQEQARLAQTHASVLDALVHQRDEMIMLSSRFSAVNSLAMYNTAVVHEISQPLQALTSVLDLLALRTAQSDVGVCDGVAQARTLVTKLAGTAGALRQLISAQPVSQELLEVDAVVGDIVPIVQGEARRQQVVLEWTRHTGEPLTILANKVLLQRLVLNLVTNAFEALTNADRQPGTGRIEIETLCLVDHGAHHAVVRIRDNGPGLPAQFLDPARAPFSTTKPEGLGVGLSLAQSIVHTWGGRLELRNLPPEQGGGACAEVWIPLQDPPPPAAA